MFAAITPRRTDAASGRMGFRRDQERAHHPAGAPSGLHVGNGAKPPTAATGEEIRRADGLDGKRRASGKTEMASASVSRARTSVEPHTKAELRREPTPLERQIFRDRRLYSNDHEYAELQSRLAAAG